MGIFKYTTENQIKSNDMRSVLDGINMISKSLLIPKCILKIKNWRVPVSFYFGKGKEEKTVILKDGTKCIIRNKSDAIAFLENFVLEANTSHKNFQINEYDTVVDIGAHVGYFALFAAKRAKMVIAVEPSSDSFSILERNIQINNFKNIIPEKSAVAKEIGQQILFLDKEGGISNSMYRHQKNLSEEKVPTITLEKIFEEYGLKKIDFLKMDCEGAEHEIIINAPSSVLDKINKISAEIHEEFVPYQKQSIIDRLEKHGFIVKLQESIMGIKMELPLLFAWKQ